MAHRCKCAHRVCQVSQGNHPIPGSRVKESCSVVVVHATSLLFLIPFRCLSVCLSVFRILERLHGWTGPRVHDVPAVRSWNVHFRKCSDFLRNLRSWQGQCRRVRHWKCSVCGLLGLRGRDLCGICGEFGMRVVRGGEVQHRHGQHGLRRHASRLLHRRWVIFVR